MFRRIVATTLWLTIVWLLVSCVPKLETSDNSDLAGNGSLSSKVFPVQLTRSEVLIGRTATPASAASSSKDEPTEVTLLKCDRPDLPSKGCLDELSATVVPTPAPTIYFAQRNAGSTFAPTYASKNSFVLTKLDVKYTSPVTSGVATIGGMAAAGFPVAGPTGAIIGGVLGIVDVIVQPQEAKPADADAWTAQICPNVSITDADGTSLDARNEAKTKKIPITPEPIALPIVVPFPGVGQEERADGTLPNCWSPLPTRKTNTDVLLSGWFYRFVPITKRDAPKPNLSDGKSYFPPLWTTEVPDPSSSAGLPLGMDWGVPSNNAMTQSLSRYVPASACRSVILQIAWWTDVQKLVAGQETTRSKLVVTVADPTLIQKVKIPKSGSIQFGAVCGAYSMSSPSQNEVISGLGGIFQQIGAIKTAQHSWEKTK